MNNIFKRMFTMYALSGDEIGLFDISYPEAGYVQTDKAGITIVNRFHTGVSCYAQSLLPPRFPLLCKSDNPAILEKLH